MTESTLRLAAAQVAEVYLDAEATVDKDCTFVHRAGEQGVDLVVFPEFHVPAAPQWYQYDDRYDHAEYYAALYDQAVDTTNGPGVLAPLCDAAREADVAVVVGITERAPSPSKSMYNSQAFIDRDGTFLGTRRKIAPTKMERLFHDAGDGSDLRGFESKLGTLGGLVCGEHTNPLAIFATLAAGEEIHAACWPAFPWLDEETRTRNVGIRTQFHAYAGRVPTVAASGVVDETLAETLDKPEWAGIGGTSGIIGPNGAYVAGPNVEGEGLVVADVSTAESIAGKALHDILGHYNRPDIFELRVDRSSRSLLTDVDETSG
ncbi:nitrilase-related carbon-nitrogen hydrolase [Haloferax sp. DFSO52]|uniref:nitrilase-related carbon-nitrogen hydrolase n=1 Tax=Haloferax sp. DFSO52 TaxID=3388505 RepID=UPI003A8BDAAB